MQGDQDGGHASQARRRAARRGQDGETVRNNTFAYTGEKDGVRITLFEENYVPPRRPAAPAAMIGSGRGPLTA